MHELGIAQEIVKVALDYAAKNNAKQITVFNIEISAAADESEDSLRFHIENLVRGTIAKGARIEIARVAARAQCLDCGNEFEWETPDELCPRCNSNRLHTTHQDEFKLTSIEVE